jgi:hypothetical protein
MSHKQWPSSHPNSYGAPIANLISSGTTVASTALISTSSIPALNSNVAFIPPRKYTLQPPQEKKKLNARLGPPEYFPMRKGKEPEDMLSPLTIQKGFTEPSYIQVCIIKLFKIRE